MSGSKEAALSGGPRAGSSTPFSKLFRAMSNTISPPISKTSSTASPTAGRLEGSAARFLARFFGAVDDTKELTITQVSTHSTRSRAAFFPRAPTDAIRALCPVCGAGRLG